MIGPLPIEAGSVPQVQPLPKHPELPAMDVANGMLPMDVATN
jgi:hypothetical protein